MRRREIDMFVRLIAPPGDCQDERWTLPVVSKAMEVSSADLTVLIFKAAPSRRRRSRVIAVRAERDVELATDLGDDLGRVIVVAQPRDPVAVQLDPHDGMHFVTRPPEEDRFPPVRAELTSRRSHELVSTLGTAEEHSLQRSGPDCLGPVLDLEARILQSRRIEDDRGETIEVPRVDGLANSVDDCGGRP